MWVMGFSGKVLISVNISFCQTYVSYKYTVQHIYSHACFSQKTYWYSWNKYHSVLRVKKFVRLHICLHSNASLTEIYADIAKLTLEKNCWYYPHGRVSIQELSSFIQSSQNGFHLLFSFYYFTVLKQLHCCTSCFTLILSAFHMENYP